MSCSRPDPCVESPFQASKVAQNCSETAILVSLAQRTLLSVGYDSGSPVICIVRVRHGKSATRKWSCRKPPSLAEFSHLAERRLGPAISGTELVAPRYLSHRSRGAGDCSGSSSALSGDR